MALFAVTLNDQTTDFVEGADAYQQEGPLTTFFSFQSGRQVIDSWSVRLATYRTAEAQMAQTLRQLDAAQLGARPDLVAAAEAEAERANAAVREAEVGLAQLAVDAPAAGLIENVFFRSGEWVPASQPATADQIHGAARRYRAALLALGD